MASLKLLLQEVNSCVPSLQPPTASSASTVALPSSLHSPIPAPSSSVAEPTGRKRNNGHKHDERATQERPSGNTLSHVLSHGAAIEVDLDAAQLDAAKGGSNGKSRNAEEIDRTFK
ncbi:hypothetical protein BT96DRAFT_1009406 [Gymnopus androsaceus JB14]|uniref:Uncharacterized protein n=1 Tax=Gymnopus androsaceus JB14 TaxID=1447944 RepID=A0A6A4GCZ3_9AGAR|nr:hypothetical protein BT96DRAFT_1009406 [Gymnopus androsaceus JB14]